MRWSPDRLKEGRPLARPPTYVTGTSAWAVYAYAPDLCVIEDLRGEAPSRSLRLPRLRALRVWDAGLVVSYGDAVAFLRLDTGEVVDTKPLRGDLVANLAVSPTGDAAYVWTQRGRVLRFGIRRDE